MFALLTYVSWLLSIHAHIHTLRVIENLEMRCQNEHWVKNANPTSSLGRTSVEEAL
ncbi:MAG: hypothetical protein R2685_12835 [Candidatus Nitrosocosmicus sp.]|nr:hypothetical protein [Candidatus Nitrosocosmicus sp.]